LKKSSFPEFPNWAAPKQVESWPHHKEVSRFTWLSMMIHAALKQTIGDVENKIQTHVHAMGQDGKPTEYNRIIGTSVYASFVYPRPGLWTGFRTHITTF
jgi:hypothetical protein